MSKGYFINSGQNGQPKGWDISKVREEKYLWICSKTIFKFDLIARHPITFIDGSGDHWQPNRSFETDGGTFPSNPLMSNFRFLGFFFHDSAYRDGGLFRSDDGFSFKFHKMTRLQIDDKLNEMMYCDPDPSTRTEAVTVYSFVRAFGGFFFHPEGGGDLKKKRK